MDEDEDEEDDEDEEEKEEEDDDDDDDESQGHGCRFIPGLVVLCCVVVVVFSNANHSTGPERSQHSGGAGAVVRGARGPGCPG